MFMKMRKSVVIAIVLLLALAMSAGMLPLLAVAGGSTNPDNYKNQIYGGREGQTAPLMYDENGADPSVSGKGWAVTTSKTITDRVRNIDGTLSDELLPENVFEITLEVKTNVDFKSYEISPDTAVVLTIDISGSMAYNAAGTTTTTAADRRMNIAKKAAEKFIDEYAASAKQNPGDPEEEGADRWIAVVVFGLDAWVIQDWINVGGVGGANTANTQTVKDQIEKLRDSTNSSTGNIPLQNGTFMQGGLRVARNLYSNNQTGNGADASAVDNRFVLLLTDGNPNCYTTLPDVTDTTKYLTGNRLTQTSEASEDNAGWAAARPYTRAVADEIRSGTTNTRSAILYTIAYNTGTASVPTSGADTDGYRGTAFNWLRDKIAYDNTISSNGTDYNYAKTATDDLDVVFDAIKRNILRWAEAWKVTDPMGANIVYTGTADATSNPKITKIDGVDTLEWDLKEDNTHLLPVRNEDGSFSELIFTYRYTIELNTLGSGFIADTTTDTNGETTLIYVINEAINDGDPTRLSQEIAAPFTIPSVKGFADSLTFRKVGSNDESTGLNGFGFTLYVDGGDGYVRYGRERFSRNDGMVTFSNIPSGHDYVIRETTNPAPRLYGEANDVTFKVDYGKVINLTGLDSADMPDGTLYQLVNPAKDVPITVSKNFFAEEGTLRSFGNYDDDYRFEFTFTLYDKDDNIVTDGNGNPIATTTSLSKDQILAFFDGEALQFMLTVPAGQIANGPFVIKETGKEDDYWELNGDEENIRLRRRAPTEVEMDNYFGGIRIPRFSITKNFIIERANEGYQDEVFYFDLYEGTGDDKVLLDRTISITGDGRANVRLDEYINKTVTLTLVEKDSGSIGMTYDPAVYTIEIDNGRVVSVVGNNEKSLRRNAEFENTYFAPISPEFTVQKTVEGYTGTYSGSFAFEYVYEGTTWDGEHGHELVPTGKVTVSGGTVSVGAGTEVKLPDLTNFTGTIEIYEIGSTPNWTYDNKHVFMSFIDGVIEEQWNGPEDAAEETDGQTTTPNVVLGVASFNNIYEEPYTPPPTPNPQYGSLTITKVISGVTAPAGYTATFSVTGPRGYSNTVTLTGAGSQTLTGLNPGSYTVTETSASEIAGYVWSVSGSGETVSVAANQTSNVTITNSYTAPPPSITEPPTLDITPPEVPLAETPPVEEVEEIVEIGNIDTPLGELPQTDGLSYSLVQFLALFGIWVVVIGMGTWGISVISKHRVLKKSKG